ncbi:MAG: ATP-dependent DNA helicase [Acidobacteria bacterium]|nr:ATP-dependent DNA helicase [Acidobacteriota bacterium]MYF13322.1 ATP-dependent DNA helicase [Acidobacteriota bacterium]MYI96810.1 ATP-dependent DNA helicase [Acidobacteriota bacterium]
MSRAADFLGPHGVLAESLPGFEHRAGQVEMAARVEETLNRDGALMIEAGTGIGKSFAYLIPALLCGERVVISTATKNLQDQLFEKDLPQLQGLLGSRVPVVRMKGRENYLCRLEWEKFQTEGDLKLDSRRSADLRRIAAWAEKTKTGDRDEIRGLRGPTDYWRGISTISENCIGRRCPHYEECHLTTLRKQAHSSRILIVNHHLLVADLIVRQTDFGEVLPEYDHLIVDEAHRLEDAATHGLSSTLSGAAADRLATDLTRFLKRSAPEPASPPAIRKLRRSYRELFETLAPERDDGPRLFHPERLPPEAREHAEAASLQLQALEGHLLKVREALRENPPPDGSDGETGAERLLKRITEFRIELSALMTSRPDYVHWSVFRRETARPENGNGKARTGRGPTCFASTAPVHPGDELRQGLFDPLKSCVLTSATLALDSGFDYAADALGVTATSGKVVPSPFRFEDQARLYVPHDLVDPRNPGFQDAAAERILQLVSASRGRALILFTSWGNLERVGRVVGTACPFPVLRQQRGGGHAALLNSFRKTPNAVLLGVRSFWEGVDVPGAALTLLVIDKLPFPVPSDPLHRARAERAEEATGDGFNNYSVPQAALTLKQGLGRLIRTQQDVGLAAVLDSRLVRMGYGRRLLRSLPPFPLITGLDEATGFLESLP